MSLLRPASAYRQRLLPAVLGFGAGVLQFAIPESLGALIVIVAAFAAGWVLPEEPMMAALLFLMPAAVLGAARVLVEEGSAAVGALALALVVALLFIAFVTHIGAGVALRRRHPGQRD